MGIEDLWLRYDTMVAEHLQDLHEAWERHNESEQALMSKSVPILDEYFNELVVCDDDTRVEKSVNQS